MSRGTRGCFARVLDCLGRLRLRRGGRVRRGEREGLDTARERVRIRDGREDVQ
jgi:hypothetical protein